MFNINPCGKVEIPGRGAFRLPSHFLMAAWLAAGLLILTPAGCGNGTSEDAGDDDGPGDDGVTDTGGDTDAADPPGDPADDPSADPLEDPAVDPGEDPAADPIEDGVVVHECPAGEKLCLDHVTRRFCTDTAGGRRWQDEACPDGHGCLVGECTEGSCSDACNLIDYEGERTCQLYDITTDSWILPDPAAFLHDRSRAYIKWLQRDGLYFGGVGNAVYSDPEYYNIVIYHGGMGDSAIWTGTYLAAEAKRLMATGSADARSSVIELVNTLHLWFNVTGAPGVLARWVAPAGESSHTELNCSDEFHHCGVEYDGAPYDYLGHISRDQYQGVMLGYALAYEALGGHDEATRALIREDVIEFVEELMMERTVPLQITWNGTDWPIRNITIRYMVLCTAELTDEGAIHLVLDTGNFDNSLMYGFQEFMPNWGDMISQVPGFGMFDNVPRADSAVMLASFFRVAMLVTDGIPGYEADHEAFRNYYYSNPAEAGGSVHDWIGTAARWSYNDDCGGSYYANNIVLEPMYNWARLEDDVEVRLRIMNEVVAGRMWPEHANTKNCFFFYIYAGLDPWTYEDAAAIAGEQLPGFPPPPRIRTTVNLTSDPRYPHESGCDNQCTRDTSVDVAERKVSDFMWQRNPWELLDVGNPAFTYPGIDFLVAYWMGRHLGSLTDDTPGKCLAWH